MSDERIILSQVTVTEIMVTTRTKHIDEHWCDHPGCKRWGCFGYAGRSGTLWVGGEHRGDAGDVPTPMSSFPDA